MGVAAANPGLDRLLSDERLTSRAVGGDDRAFAAIFRRYHQSLYRFCLAILGNPEDAQDALQNTMTKVLRALPGEERKIELKPWLYRIARNESIDLLRRRRETRDLDSELVAPGHGLAEEAATRERLRRLLVDLGELPERQREVLVMRELGGLGFKEIGVALATSAAVVRQTLYEARQSLRQMEEGREMRCDLVTRALSDGDGRVLRRRDVRAHLRTCAGCRSFGEGIETRERSFAALSPLPGVAAAGMLQGLLGGSQAGAGGGLAAILGGGTAKTVGASAAAKGVATVAVVAAVGVGAADRAGVIDVGLRGDGGAKSSEATPGPPAPELVAEPGTAVDGGTRGGLRSEPAESRASGSPAEGTPVARTAPAPVAATGHGLESRPAGPQADPRTSAAPLEHGAGHGRQEQHQVAAGHGQDTAEKQAPQSREPEGGASDEAPVDSPKAAPAAPGSASHGNGPPEGRGASQGNGPPEGKGPPEGNGPPEGKGPPAGKGPPEGKGPPASAPASPPAAKPESPPQGPPPSPPKAEPPASPAAPQANPGKGAEKSAEAGNKP
jgi:RNA polymerase sigma factor (sigma-70 family)